MANTHKGEVSVVIGSTTYTLALTLNAMCELQEKFGESWEKVAAKAEQGSPLHLRSLLWVSLRKHHKDLTLEEFGDMDLVDVRSLGRAFAQLVEASTPDSRDVQALQGGKSKRPRGAQAGQGGTGVNSTSTPARLA